MRSKGYEALMMIAMMLFSSVLFILLGAGTTGADAAVGANEAPPRAIYRYFSGTIKNLDATNAGNFNSYKNVTAAGRDSSDNIVGPFWTSPSDWNLTTFVWTVQVDIQPHDNTKPWTISFADRYGWNRTGFGTVVQVPDSNWYNGNNPTWDLPPDTLEYIWGVHGGLKITVFNGSSGEPLPEVGFSFERHAIYNTMRSGDLIIQGNVTDGNGEVLFQNMQLGRDTNNRVKIRFLADHFSTSDKTGIAYFPLRRDVISEYNITLVEDNLVQQHSPSNGAVDVETNRTRVRNSLFVKFPVPMDRASINSNTVYLVRAGGGKVPTTFEWDVTDTYLNLLPSADLEYNTQYTMFVTARVQNETGAEPLWRTFSTSFTTHKRPAILRGTVYMKGTTDPAPDGSMVQLNFNPPVELVNGNFNFSNVLPNAEGYNVSALGPTVSDEKQYLYKGNWKSGIMVQRGDVIDITGLYVEERPTRSLIFNVFDNFGSTLPDVEVTHLVTKQVQKTNEEGVAIFQDVLKERPTSFRFSLLNYYLWTQSVPSGWLDTETINIILNEKELPIVIKAWTDTAQELTQGVVNIIPAEAYFKLEFASVGTPINMDPDTMNSENLQLKEDGGATVPIDIEHDVGDMSVWSMEPRTDLKYSTNYTLIVKEQVADQLGNNPLWRDYVIRITTIPLDPASINGKVSVKDRGVEGIPIAAYRGEDLIESTESGPNGFYILDIQLIEREVTGIRIEVDGSAFGLTPVNLSGLVLRAGSSLNNTDFDLMRSPDWLTLNYPKDHMGLLEIGGSISVSFRNPLKADDLETFADNFSMRGAPDIGISLSTDKRSVILDPDGDLEYDRAYELSISVFSEGEGHRELMFATGVPALIGGERILINTTLKPIQVIVSLPPSETNVSRTERLSLYFTNYSIDASKLEPKIELKKALGTETLGNLTFEWTENDRTLNIKHSIFDILTTYQLFIPSGIYGKTGAMIKEDFLFEFTTKEDRLIGGDIPTITVPAEVVEGKVFTITVSNNIARALNMIVEVKRNDQTTEWTHLLNFTLNSLERDRSVPLDIKDMEKGEYQVRIRSYDPATGALLDERTVNFTIKEKDDATPPYLIWIWIVIVVIVIVIAVLGVYLYTQSRKKGIEEELKEEFECPECHNVVSADDAVCPHCGAEFEESAYKCPKCGAMLDHEAEECSECGYDFSDQDKMELEDEEADEEEEEEGEDISEMYEEDEEGEEEEEEMEELEEEEDEDED